jgi:uncharacterized protein
MQKVICLTAVLLLLALGASAQTKPNFPKQNGWTNDFENDLDLATIVQLNKMIETHKTKTGNQIVVVTVASAAPYNNFYDYTEDIAKAWQVGGKDNKTGVTILMSEAGGDVKIYCGSTLKTKLGAETYQKIINQKMLPKFKEGNYDQGLIDGVAEIIKLLEAA